MPLPETFVIVPFDTFTDVEAKPPTASEKVAVTAIEAAFVVVAFADERTTVGPFTAADAELAMPMIASMSPSAAIVPAAAEARGVRCEDLISAYGLKVLGNTVVPRV